MLPEEAKFVCIHGSGDFFSQAYFGQWLDVVRSNPDVHFWTFTKLLRFWIERIDSIPNNLVLTASYGGWQDDLIDKHNLRSAKVYNSEKNVPPNMEIDTNDALAMRRGASFALINNKQARWKGFYLQV